MQTLENNIHQAFYKVLIDERDLEHLTSAAIHALVNNICPCSKAEFKAAMEAISTSL